MNYGRVALAAVAATVVDFVYGFFVYGNLLTSEFAKYPNIFRPAETQMAFLPMMFAGFLVAMAAAVLIYGKGYEGGSGIAEGTRFGLLIAVFQIGYVVLGNHAVMQVNLRLTAYLALAALAEWLIVGITIGSAYKPSAAASSRTPEYD
jgi:hypothetical protein